MEVYIDWEDEESENESQYGLGFFDDLVAWVKEFNRAWAGRMKYALEPVGDDGSYLFYEMDPNSDEFSVGTIHRRGDEAHALREVDHKLVWDAFERYKDEFGA